MAYVKTVWANGIAPALNETNLNNIEDGLEEASKRPENEIIISPTGGDYATIQDALDGGGTPLANTMFVVYPGTYINDTIHFTANNQYVVGAQNVAPKVVLVTNSVNICNYGAFTNCIVKDIKMQMTLLSTVADSTVNGDVGGSCNLKHCHVECNVPVGDLSAEANGGATAVRGHGTVK